MGHIFATEYRPKDEEYGPEGNFHSTYFHVVFGDLRYRMLDELGIGAEWFKSQEFALVASSQQCDFFRPIKRGDHARIEIAIKALGGHERFGNCTITFMNSAYRASDGQLSASGLTVSVVISLKTGKRAEIPERVREVLTPLLVEK